MMPEIPADPRRRSPWPRRALIVGVLLLALPVWAYVQPRLPPGRFTLDRWALDDAPLQRRPDRSWLVGLTAVQRIEHREYARNRLQWELRAPSANVRTMRYAYGYVRGHLLLHLVQPVARLHLSGAPVDIRASRAYYDPPRGEWVFVQGELSQARRRTRFQRLYWYPDENRLQEPAALERHPLFRYWYPQY